MSYNMFIRIFFGTLLQLEVHIAITESSTIISEDTHTSHWSLSDTVRGFPSTRDVTWLKAGHMLQIAYFTIQQGLNYELQ